MAPLCVVTVVVPLYAGYCLSRGPGSISSTGKRQSFQFSNNSMAHGSARVTCTGLWQLPKFCFKNVCLSHFCRPVCRPMCQKGHFSVLSCLRRPHNGPIACFLPTRPISLLVSMAYC